MIQIFSYIFIFNFGLIIGSFLNCVIYRLEINKTFLKGRSFCPNCKHKLNFFDLIPVFSFIFLKAKCRYCGTKISFQYPLVEIATGLIFLLIFNLHFSIIITLYLFVISCLLIIIFVYDLKHYIIPDKIIYPAILIALIFNFSNLLSGFLAAGFFLLIVLISKGRWMGVGDIKLAFLMGLMLGFPKILVGLFLAFLIGSIIGMLLIFLHKKTFKSEVPFAPFLIIGLSIAYFFGEKLIVWYSNLFLI